MWFISQLVLIKTLNQPDLKWTWARVLKPYMKVVINYINKGVGWLLSAFFPHLSLKSQAKNFFSVNYEIAVSNPLFPLFFWPSHKRFHLPPWKLTKTIKPQPSASTAGSDSVIVFSHGLFACTQVCLVSITNLIQNIKYLGIWHHLGLSPSSHQLVFWLLFIWTESPFSIPKYTIFTLSSSQALPIWVSLSPSHFPLDLKFCSRCAIFSSFICEYWHLQAPFLVLLLATLDLSFLFNSIRCYLGFRFLPYL